MRGFSMIELIIVVGIMAILTAISVPYLFFYKTLYKSEDQALKVMDLMREASQLAMTRRRLIRFEIDLTTNRALIIDGNDPGWADDRLIKGVPLETVDEVRMDQIPAGVTKPNPPNYADVAYVVDGIGHLDQTGTPVIGNTVWQVAFRRDGTVVNSLNNPVSANLYFWPPVTPGSATPRSEGEVRAVTMFGGSGAVRYWKYVDGAFQPYQ